MKLDKRGRSRAFILGGLLLAYFLAMLFVSNPHIAFLVQFSIALIGVSLIVSYILQAFSLAKWKRMLTLSLLIISALTWYVYPGLTTASTSIVTSYQELVKQADVIVIGHFKTTSYAHGSQNELYVRVLRRTPKMPSPDCQIYSFIADQYITGDGPESMTIIDYNPLVSLEDYQNIPKADELVVLFFKSSKKRYAQTWVKPYMFKLVDNTLYVQSNIPEVIDAFPPITLNELKEMIGD